MNICFHHCFFLITSLFKQLNTDVMLLEMKLDLRSPQDEDKRIVVTATKISLKV